MGDFQGGDSLHEAPADGHEGAVRGDPHLPIAVALKGTFLTLVKTRSKQWLSETGISGALLTLTHCGSPKELCVHESRHQGTVLEMKSHGCGHGGSAGRSLSCFCSSPARRLS